MSCAIRTSAAINTPSLGDLVCRRCVPCTIHPHIEQGPSSSTEKVLGVAPDNAHAEARKGTKRTGTNSSPNKSYTTFDTTQCNSRPDTMKSSAVKQLKKPRQQLENKPAKSDEAWLTALNDSFPQAIDPHTPEPSEQRRPDDIWSHQRREIPQQRRTDLWVRRNQSNPYQIRSGSWIRKIEERRQFPHRYTATPQPRRPESWPDSSEEEESPCGRRTVLSRRTNS
ncbi:hypothetical protein DID88_004369 [Monilinia fructigena]|uniref:Uncharacterized protein n=1 Tax=Monilinia fructigena TaxID=38457 RepID=A0A395IV49_9HELO|nr:hypothetical protein DID88_004369 [Monilinia fructigena]